MLTISMISCATNWDRWDECYDTGNFTANSTYATNRNLLLSSLATNITVLNSGFYNTTIGQEPDKVYGLALCRGDGSSEDCSSCVNSTSQDIMSTCHSQKEALMWDGDPPCLVHYADRSLFGKMEMSVPINPYYRGNNLTMNLTEFDKIWQPLMERTMREASRGSSRLKFATQEANLTSIQKIHTLMQCRPDLSQNDCYVCLTRCLDEYKKSYHGRQGGGVESPNCMLRWDLSLFYKDIVLPPLPSPPPAPTTMAEDKGGIAAGTVVIIVVSIIIFMLLVSICCFFLGMLKQKQIRNNQGRKYLATVSSTSSVDIGLFCSASCTICAPALAPRAMVTIGASRLLFFLFCAPVHVVTFTISQPDFFYHHCLSENGNYTTNNTYQANLNSLLSSISSNSEINYGFYNFSVGQGSDKVNVIALCREDINLDVCHS
ncbi:hypothetical protein EZV62_026477 [Acer yangbiense]|uniref:Gnk2-homologous domain-containing protein n=1 Tax=Acer yangbiense TaxID=1000413 RepID=A0A5C7GRF5_9ROSI|nr:hypothetical protein EZV62_026477 [Acer yangbiense]